MKLLNNPLIPLLALLSLPVLSAPVAPVLSYGVDGLTVDIDWTPVEGATQYKLSYAPYPYTGLESIKSIDLGTDTSFSADLWNGAAFYIAVQAGDGQGYSGYSNIENFTVTATPPTSYNLSGNWHLTETIGGSQGCDSGIRTPINSLVEVNQMDDTVSIKLPGGSVMGDIDENDLNMGGTLIESNGSNTFLAMAFTLTLTPGNNNLSGHGSWGSMDGSTTSCSGSSQISLIKK